MERTKYTRCNKHTLTPEEQKMLEELKASLAAWEEENYYTGNPNGAMLLGDNI